MSMPLMPGIVGEGAGEAAAQPDAVAALVEILDLLSDEDVAALAGGGEGEAPPEAPAEAPAEGGAAGAEAMTEPAAGGAEGETEEGAEEEVDLAPVQTGAEAAVEEVAASVTQLEELQAQADENKKQGADPAAVKDLLKQAEGEQKAVEKAKDDCAKRADKGDVQGATECGIEAQRCADKAAALVEQARGLVGATKPEKGAEDPDAEAMRLWSERVMGGGG